MRLLVSCLLLLCSAQLTAAESLATLIRSGDLSKIETMLDAQPELLEKRLENGRTALLMAAAGNKLSLVQALVKRGADTKAVDRYQKTALHLAAEQRMVDAVSVLCEAGCEVDAVDANGYTALGTAISRRDVSMVKVLLSFEADPLKFSGRRKSPLYNVLYASDLEMAKMMIAAVKDLSAELKRNPGLVSRSLDNRKIDTFNLLLPHIDVKDFRLDDGRTHIMHTAARRNRLEAVKTMIEKGVSIELESQPGQTVLHHAVNGRAFAVVEFLLKQKANMYPSTGEKQQSMMAQIISRNDFESLLLFLQHGYEVNKMDHNGLTALHHAAGYGKFGLAIILLQHDADINAVSKDGLSPLAMAMQKKQDYVAALLRERKAELIGPAFKLAESALRNNRIDEALLHLKSLKPDSSQDGLDRCVSECFARGAIDCLAAIKNAGFSITNSTKGQDYLYNYFSRAKCKLEDVKKLEKLGCDFKAIDAKSSILSRIVYRREVTVVRSGSYRDPETGAELLKIAAYLIDQGLVNKEKSYGSFVMEAVDRKDKELAEFLISKGLPFLGKRDSISQIASRYRRNKEMMPWVLTQLAKTEKPDVVFNLVIQTGDLGLLQKVYDPETMNVDTEDKDGMTPLMHAVAGRNVEAVKWLIANGADLNKKNTKKKYYGSNDSSTPVMIAITNSSKDMLGMLLEAKADPNQVGASGFAPLHVVVQRRGASELCALLLAKGAKANQAVQAVNQHQSYLGYTALHFLANRSSVKSIEEVKPILDMLIKHGGTLDAKERTGKTPSQIAVSRSNFFFLKSMSGHDQNIDEGELEKAEFLALLQQRNVNKVKEMLQVNPELIKTISEDTKQVTNVLRSKNKELLDLIVEYDDQLINRQNKYSGTTLLMDYVQRFDQGAVEFLLAYKPDLEAKSKTDWTALHYAEFNTSRSPKARPIVKMLTDAGAKPTGITQAQWTIYSALRYKKRDSLEILLNNWDELEVWPKTFEHPLVLTVQAKNYDMFGELLARGLDPNVKDKRGMPVLFKVVSDRRVQALKALLDKKVDLTVKDAHGNDLDMYVQRIQDKFIAEMLKIELKKPNKPMNADKSKQEALIKEIKKDADPIDDF